MGCEVNSTNKPGLHNFNIGAGHPDLGGGCGIPPPAEHVFARFEVLWHDNVVLVDALLVLHVVDWPLVPPGAALRVGADTQVCLLLRLPEWGVPLVGRGQFQASRKSWSPSS